jgi:predicted phosphodiesterase
MRKISLAALGIAFAIVALIAPAAQAEPNSGDRRLTFYGWSDQHVTTDGGVEHVMPAARALNQLPDTPMPDEIGGQARQPSFVIGCGDITEWPTHAAKDAYARIVTEVVKWPVYDIAGNHDSGGKEPSDTVHQWLRKRHGALSYTFEKQGVHFICAFSKFDAEGEPAQPLTDKALGFIRSELQKLPSNAPAVVATHLCLDAMTNADDLVEAFGDANVIMVLGGHYHKAKVQHHRGYPFVQIPAPDTNRVTYFDITPKRVLAVPYNFKTDKWLTGPNRMLYAPIHWPASKQAN